MNVLYRSQFGDFANTFRIQNIVGIKVVHWRLLKIINRYIFKHITVQVIADNLDNAITKANAVFKQIDKIHIFAHCFQGFRELGIK